MLVTDAGEELLKAGDCAGFKAGHPDGHHLLNRSGRNAVLLRAATRLGTMVVAGWIDARVVEDELAVTGWLPSLAVVEYQRAIMPGCLPLLVTNREDGQATLWLLDGQRVLASAQLSR